MLSVTAVNVVPEGVAQFVEYDPVASRPSVSNGGRGHVPVK